MIAGERLRASSGHARGWPAPLLPGAGFPLRTSSPFSASKGARSDVESQCSWVSLERAARGAKLRPPTHFRLLSPVNAASGARSRELGESLLEIFRHSRAVNPANGVRSVTLVL